MNTNAPTQDALDLLKTVFELGEVGMRPSEELLMRLRGLRESRLRVLLRELRQRRLLQEERLAVTMAGLMIATALPDPEVQPMAQSSRRTPLPTTPATDRGQPTMLRRPNHDQSPRPANRVRRFAC